MKSIYVLMRFGINKYIGEISLENKQSLEIPTHMTEPEVHPKKYFDQIEVFGSMEKRSWIHGPKSPKRFF